MNIVICSTLFILQMATIADGLFPLWPPWINLVVYSLSIALIAIAASLVLTILFSMVKFVGSQILVTNEAIFRRRRRRPLPRIYPYFTIGAIAVCLFPLWPPWMRLVVHYLSIAAAAFLVFIILLGIVKYIIFAILFMLSAGKLRFWLFPNLTEDVGFMESFWPICDYTYTGNSGKKAKDSDDEESDDEDDNNEKNDEADQSESDDSTSKKSSVAGKDFEMVDKHEDTDA